MLSKKNYVLSSKVVTLGEWAKRVEENSKLILSVIDLLRKFDRLNDATTHDEHLFIDFITDCFGKTVSNLASMDVAELYHFDPYEYSGDRVILMTTDQILSKISVRELSNSDDEITDMVDKVIKSMPGLTLREYVREEAIRKLEKINNYLIENKPKNWDEERLDSCLNFATKYGI